MDACICLMKCSDVPEIINIGAGSDISIRKLAELIKQIVGFNGRIKYDASKPDGTQRKLLDISRLKSLGWRAQVDLRSGLKDVYNWYTKGGAR